LQHTLTRSHTTMTGIEHRLKHCHEASEAPEVCALVRQTSSSLQTPNAGRSAVSTPHYEATRCDMKQYHPYSRIMCKHCNCLEKLKNQ